MEKGNLRKKDDNTINQMFSKKNKRKGKNYRKTDTHIIQKNKQKDFIIFHLTNRRPPEVNSYEPVRPQKESLWRFIVIDLQQE